MDSPAAHRWSGRTVARRSCDRWKQQGLEQEWRARTGLLLDPYFSASKIHWLIQHESAARQAADQNDLCFGTVESWLLWHLSGPPAFAEQRQPHAVDDRSGEWVEPFCEQAQLHASALPTLVPCRGDFGEIAPGLPFAGVPIRALLGDQQAATLGQLCLEPGEAKCTYGTGASWW